METTHMSNLGKPVSPLISNSTVESGSEMPRGEDAAGRAGGEEGSDGRRTEAATEEQQEEHGKTKGQQ